MNNFLMFVLLGILCLSSSAQTNLPNTCSVSMPILFDKSTLSDSDIHKFFNSSSWGQDRKTNHYWVVYSDRANNVTYKSPDSKSEPFATLNFNEKLRVAKIQNGYALVYVEQYTAAIYPQIIKPVSKGWIPMSHLLLWSCCLADERGTRHMVFLSLNIDEFEKTKRKDFGNVYDNPIERTYSSPSSPVNTGTEFFFVIKEDKETGMVLLSRSKVLNGLSSHVLYGWTDKTSCITWSQRVFLEPNWDPDVVEKLKGSKVDIYRRGKKVLDFTFGKINELGQEQTKYRIPPDKMHYPLLGNESGNDNQYRIIAFASMGVSEPTPIAFQGITDKKSSQTGLDYWQPVILLSSDDYNDLISKFIPVMAAAEEGNEDRRPYVEAMKEVVRILSGVSEKEMMLKSTKEVIALVEGLVVRTDALKGRSLEEIQDYNNVSQEEFDTMISNFRNKFKKLDRIKNGYKYSIKIVGDTWYWIPVRDLP